MKVILPVRHETELNSMQTSRKKYLFGKLLATKIKFYKNLLAS